MRNGTRLLVATATGAAVFAGGTSSAFATRPALLKSAAACEAVTADISEVKVGDAFVPLKEDNKIGFEATLRKPFKDKDANGAWPVEGNGKQVQRAATRVTAEVTRADGTVIAATDLILPKQPETTDAEHKVADVPQTAVLKGDFTVTAKDRDGTWQIRLRVTKAGADGGTCKEVGVDPQVKYVGASVTDPVVVTAGKDTKVVVRARVVGASSVSARLSSDDANDSVELRLSKGRGATTWYRNTLFDDGFSTGGWTLELTATRGKESVKVGKADAFTVRAAKARKAGSKVSFDVSANTVRKGKAIRLFGTAYRGGSAYAGKAVALYRKRKGSSGWTFVAFATANGQGRFGKVVRPKSDAYWRAVLPGTSRTYGAVSGAEFVDVRGRTARNG
ncbi:hypothetical protein GCM10017673_16580 [Streptosporangium violaceochromogenes]|nr:hypothetical protein GCM10017673_16580 [Streptosporangium violaceochromogenes]